MFDMKERTKKTKEKTKEKLKKTPLKQTSSNNNNNKNICDMHCYLPPISALRAVAIMLFPSYHCHCHYTNSRRAV